MDIDKGCAPHLHVEEGVVVQVAVIVHIWLHTPVVVELLEQRVQVKEPAVVSAHVMVRLPAHGTDNFAEHRTLPLHSNIVIAAVYAVYSVRAAYSLCWSYYAVHADVTTLWQIACFKQLPVDCLVDVNDVTCPHTRPCAEAYPSALSQPPWGQQMKGNPSALGESHRTASSRRWLQTSWKNHKSCASALMRTLQHYAMALAWCCLQEFLMN